MKLSRREWIRELLIFFPFFGVAVMSGNQGSYGFDWSKFFGFIVAIYGAVMFIRGCWYIWKTREKKP